MSFSLLVQAHEAFCQLLLLLYGRFFCCSSRPQKANRTARNACFTGFGKLGWNFSLTYPRILGMKKAAHVDSPCVHIGFVDNGNTHTYGVEWLNICVMLILHFITLQTYLTQRVYST